MPVLHGDVSSLTEGQARPRSILSDGAGAVSVTSEKSHMEGLANKLESAVRTAIPDEYADLMQVLIDLSAAFGIPWVKIEQRLMAKRAERGSFRDGVVLETLYE